MVVLDACRKLISPPRLKPSISVQMPSGIVVKINSVWMNRIERGELRTGVILELARKRVYDKHSYNIGV